MNIFIYSFLFAMVALTQGCATLFTTPYPSAIPDRPQKALSGSDFIRSIAKDNEYDREIAILKEIRRGNIPSFVRNLKTISLEHRFKNGKVVKATLWAMPDYLSVGRDDDFIRVPMNPITAQRIADHFGFILPTTKIVDEIYRQADIKLSPATFKPGNHMVRTEQFVRHHRLIQKQLAGNSQALLIAGHKKDVVISNRLLRKKQRVAIYGWHRPNGKAIQPLSTIHGNYYSDYSHGVRLISGMMMINGKKLPVAEVLQDPLLAQVISYEGSLRNTRYPTEGVLKKRLWMPK